jgi:ubiquinone/menaquinone biosynthesis C-methylase UbiE
LQQWSWPATTFFVADNIRLPIDDDSIDVVYTNSLPPFDTVTSLGPTVQTNEILRILKAGGCWINNGILHYVKP